MIEAVQTALAALGAAGLAVQRTVVTDACDLSTLVVTLAVGWLLPQPAGIVERVRNGRPPTDTQNEKPPEP